MREGKRILIIDDDEFLSDLLCEQLAGLGGYQCVAALDGKAGLNAVAQGHFDLVLLDLDMPGMGGIEVCRQLRTLGMMAPIIMFTADDSESATIEGLDAGATDYVTKPFKLGVLLARIRAQIRQFEHSEDAVLAIGPFEFRPGAKTLTPTPDQADTRPVHLTDKEAQILKYLYMHAQGDNAIIGRDELLGEVWGYHANVTTHTLETHVYRLRQKIEEDPSNAKLLVTETGGYRLEV